MSVDDRNVSIVKSFVVKLQVVNSQAEYFQWLFYMAFRLLFSNGYFIWPLDYYFVSLFFFLTG